MASSPGRGRLPGEFANKSRYNAMICYARQIQPGSPEPELIIRQSSLKKTTPPPHKICPYMLRKLDRTTANKPQQYPVRVLQFGKGNFLRAFADWMIDGLNERCRFNGAIRIVQVNARATDPDFAEQEGLYHVVINGIRDGQPVRDVRLITSVADVINPFADYDAFLAEGENPALSFIISNTTEAGIVFDARDSDPGALPQTFPGKLTALLHRRFTFFGGDPAKALTLLPCELIERNGEILRQCILQYAAHWNLGEAFMHWILNDTLFCNTLVDRIVPGFPRDEAATINRETGFDDRLLVSAEPFHLWVLQPDLRPGMSLQKLREALPLEAAGFHVRFTTDLAPYRTTKVRILNGSHTAMVPVGYLRGLRTVREVINDPFGGAFVREAIEEEIIPTLDLPADELQRFAADTIERFQNPFIRHELRSIALNAVAKYTVRVLPTVLDYIHRKGELPQRLLHALAALIVFYRGTWRGEPTPLNDAPEVISFFGRAWAGADADAVVRTVLAHKAFWNTDLTAISGVRQAVTDQVNSILNDE